MRYSLPIILLLLLTPVKADAQKVTSSPERALDAVFEKSNLMAALSGHEWRPGLNLAAAHLSVGQTISLNVTLLKDIEYVFLASGPSEQTDVDLYLRDPAGRILAEDQEKDGTPVIEFTSPEATTVQLQLHLAAGASESAFVALGLLLRGGRQVSEQSYRSVSSGFFDAAQGIALNDIEWQKKAGEWCLFGYSLKDDEGISLRGLQSSAGRNVFAAAGPKTAKIDLYLANAAGNIVATTNRPQPFPTLQYKAQVEDKFDLRVRTMGVKTPLLVLVGVFHQ